MAAAEAAPAAGGAGDDVEVPQETMNLEAVIGFNGRIPAGYVAHPNGRHVVFPLGSTVVVKDLMDDSQAFLQGHTDRVTCVALSPDGSRIASGQVTSMGLRAPVIVWDFAAAVRNANTANREGELIHKMELHKVRVQDVSFSCDGAFVASVGGQDDNSVIVWNAETGDAICGAPAGSHSALAVRWLHGRADTLMTAGFYHIKRWEVNLERKRLFPTEVATGQIKRVINCLTIDDSDTYAWCGTRSGDMLEVNISNARFTRASKNRFPGGILSVQYVPNPGGEHDWVLAGNGDGSLAKLSTRQLEVEDAVQLTGKVTSLTMAPGDRRVKVGTDAGNRYEVQLSDFDPDLVSTAHANEVIDVCFPKHCSDLFLTCSCGGIRLWNMRTRKELLRIKVPNLTCNCIAVLPDGALILSGWDDGRIRAFTPQTGKLHFMIEDAHSDAVTALCPTSDCQRLISGGKDGRVRVWNIAGSTQRLELSFKEHKRQVNSIAISEGDDECVSASADGSCIVWNLRRGTRQNALFASTVFRACVYHPDESQLLTCGSDRKLGYWDASDCSPIRIMEGSTAELASLDLEPSGRVYAAGGADRLVKLWLYDEGLPFAVGEGHSGGITQVKISPDRRTVVSVGEEGAIFVWTMPEIPPEEDLVDDDEEAAAAAAAEDGGAEYDDDYEQKEG